MGRIEFIDVIFTTIFKLFWLNIKRFPFHFLWRILMIVINFMLFFTATLPVQKEIVAYIFVLVSLANVLFIYTRIKGDNATLTLLRSLGASRIFIIADQLMEFLLQVFIAFIFFLPVIIFRKPLHSFLILFILQLLLLLGTIPLFSTLFISELEKQKKE